VRRLNLKASGLVSIFIASFILEYMFEQSLYNQEAFAPTPEIHEGDLFYNYEFKNWNFSPRLYKILGAAVLLDLLFLAVIGQADLTKKGCDTFITSTVCQVIDTAYVANVLFGTEREYADAVYEKTELKDADITFVDVSNEEPELQYPEGYFALANPEQAAFLQQQANNTNSGYIAPGIPVPTTSNDNNLLAQKAKLPKPNPNAVVGNIPSSPLGDSTDDPTVASEPNGPGSKKFPGSKTGTGQPTTSPKAGGQNGNTSATNNSTTAATEPDEAKQDQFGVYINKRPMKDQAKETIAKVTANEVKLDQPFKVVISATLGLGSDGKTIVLKNPTPEKVDKNIPNDPQLAKLAQEWILRVGDAGWFGYLDKLKSKKIVITVEQNETELIANVRADQPSVNDANSIAAGLKVLLGVAVDKAKGDDQLFLQKASVTSDGKAFILNFSIPKNEAQDMIQRKLAEGKEPAAQPSSTAVNSPAGNSASR